ncbi:MAG: hypothetical protein IJ428_01170 [Clostridia bacterium]|nr:hypothetical protein [Clostridia bacterium]
MKYKNKSNVKSGYDIEKVRRHLIEIIEQADDCNIIKLYSIARRMRGDGKK